MASKGIQPTLVKDMRVVKIDDDGSVTVKFSAEAFSALEKIIEAARPSIEAKQAQRVLEQGQGALEKLDVAMRELKHVQFVQLQEAARLGALKHAPGLQ